MELDAMATELWLLVSCEWTEAVEEGGKYQQALLLKSSHYSSHSAFSLHPLAVFPPPCSAIGLLCVVKGVSWKKAEGASSYSHWMCRIIRRTCADACRQKQEVIHLWCGLASKTNRLDSFHPQSLLTFLFFPSCVFLPPSLLCQPCFEGEEVGVQADRFHICKDLQPADIDAG